MEEVRFDTLKPGDIFKWMEGVYMKTDVGGSLQDKIGAEKGLAINARTFKCFIFLNNEMVISKQ